MSRRRLLNVGCALWQKSSSAGLKNPIAFCASFAMSSTQNEQKCCKEGQKCATSTVPAPLRHHHGSGKAKGEESFTKSGRSFCSTAPQIDHKTYLWARYNEMKRLVHGKFEESLLCTTLLLQHVLGKSDLKRLCTSTSLYALQIVTVIKYTGYVVFNTVQQGCCYCQSLSRSLPVLSL